MTADLIAKLEAAESGRPAVRTAKELEALSGRDEVVEGYLDGLQGDLEPGPNRSDGYYHGWRNGANDRAGRSTPDQRALASDLRALSTQPVSGEVADG